MTERDENIICGVLVGSLLDYAEKERLCALVRSSASLDRLRALENIVKAVFAVTEEVWALDAREEPERFSSAIVDIRQLVRAGEGEP